MRYYALYDNELDWEKDVSPSGIIIVQKTYPADWSRADYHAMHWSHQQDAWGLCPERCSRVLDANDNLERQRAVERDEAERITAAITGGEELPDEDTINWIFPWRGEPPQAENTPRRRS